MTEHYTTSISEQHDDGMHWFHPSTEHRTRAAAEAAVLAVVPTDERRFRFSAAVNEWEPDGKRIARFWTLDVGSRTFLPPRDAFPIASEATA